MLREVKNAILTQNSGIDKKYPLDINWAVFLIP
jgi:hypothetical protein